MDRYTHGLTIGLLVPKAAEPLYAELVHGVSEEASAAGYGVILGHTGDDPDHEHDQLARMLERRINGLIVVPDEQRHMQEYQQLAIPCVAIDRQTPLTSTGLPSVERDNQQAGYVATRHLINLGHTQIGIITTRENNRCSGYLRALKEAGIPIRDRLIAYVDTAISDLVTQGRTAMQTLLTKTAMTACFVVDDLRALGGLEAIHQRQLNAPHDIALVGCGDLQVALRSRPQLSTIGPSKRHLGIQATRLLLDLFQHKPTKSRVVMPVELIIRESCGAIMRSVSNPPQWLR